MDVKATMMNAADQAAMGKVDALAAKQPRENQIAQVKKLAKDFESIFLEQMFRTMRSSIQKSGLIDGGNAEEIYTSMLDSEYAKQMTEQGNGGLSQMIERQLLQSMGIKLDTSAAATKRQALHSYERNGPQPLQPDRKEVTIKTSGLGLKSAK
jgi:Rod binding domain-containing protein